MNISAVAKKTGLTSKAIRFYEEKGVVTPRCAGIMVTGITIRIILMS